MTEISSLTDDVPVYTQDGTFVGRVKNTILDLETRTVDALLITDTNESVVEGGTDVAVPYRWVSDADDIMVFRYFPDQVAEETVSGAEEAPAEDDEFIEVTA
jgi:sporulation protein YlmC with PRC-barrel domain